MSEEFSSLIRRAKEGDSDALEHLFDRSLRGLRAFVRLKSGPLVRAHESCSDLVQFVCRDVLVQARLLRRPHRDIAADLVKSEETVRKILSRARLRLAAHLDLGGSDS